MHACSQEDNSSQNNNSTHDRQNNGCQEDNNSQNNNSIIKDKIIGVRKLPKDKTMIRRMIKQKQNSQKDDGRKKHGRQKDDVRQNNNSTIKTKYGLKQGWRQTNQLFNERYKNAGPLKRRRQIYK